MTSTKKNEKGKRYGRPLMTTTKKNEKGKRYGRPLMATTKKNEKGKRYGRLLVLKESPYRSDNHAHWLCRCDCGNTAIVSGRLLRGGNTRSCGCYQRECAARAMRKLHKMPSVRKKAAAAVKGKKRVYRPDGSFFFAKPKK